MGTPIFTIAYGSTPGSVSRLCPGREPAPCGHMPRRIPRLRSLPPVCGRQGWAVEPGDREGLSRHFPPANTCPRARARNEELELLQRRREQSIGPGDQLLTGQEDLQPDKHFLSNNWDRPALARERGERAAMMRFAPSYRRIQGGRKMKARKAPTKKATITMPLTARMDLYTKMARAKIFPSFGLKAAHALRACSRKVTFGLTTPSATQSAPGSPRARKRPGGEPRRGRATPSTPR